MGLEIRRLPKYGATKAAFSSRIGALVARDREGDQKGGKWAGDSGPDNQSPRYPNSSDPNFQPYQGDGVTRDGPYRGWRAP